MTTLFALATLAVVALLASLVRANLSDRRSASDREQADLIRQLHEIQARRKRDGSRER